jgi:hypothetical protein
MRHRPLLFLVFFVCFSESVLAAETSTPEAKDRVGENATVYGVVAEYHRAASSRGHPTFSISTNHIRMSCSRLCLGVQVLAILAEIKHMGTGSGFVRRA